MGATSFERDHELTVAQQRARQAAPDRPGAGPHRRRHLRHLRVVRGAHRQDAVDGFPACHTVHDMQAARGTSLSRRRLQPIDAADAVARAASAALFAVVAARALRRRPAHQVAGRRPRSPASDEQRSSATCCAAPDPQRGRGVQHRHRLHRAVLLPRDRGRAGRARGSSRRVRSTGAGRSPSGCCWPASPATSPTGSSASPGRSRGHVVDFLMLPHWPVFNVADICINVAAALILVQAFRGIRLDGTRTRAPTPDASRVTQPRPSRRTAPSGAGRPGRRAGRRRDGPDVRPLAHPRRRPDRPRPGAGRRRGRGQERPGARRRHPRRDASRPRPTRSPSYPRSSRASRSSTTTRHRGDRQAGRRRRAPLAGLDRPDRGRAPGRRRLQDRDQRRLGAAGDRAAARRRHVGRDGDLQVRARLLGAQERLPPPRRRQGLPRAGAGPPRPARGHHRRPDRPAPEGATTSSR